jgi:hypothetical protein
MMTLLLSAALINLLGKPMGDGARSMLAFGQHYAANWVVWNNSNLNPWTNWNTIFATDFKSATTIMSAILLNPSAVLHHVYSNVFSLDVPLHRMATLIHPETLWGLKPIYFKIGWMMTLVAYVCLILFNLKRLSFKAIKTKIVQKNRQLIVLFGLVVLMVPPLISVLVIGPREHYLLFVVILLTLFIFLASIDRMNALFTTTRMAPNKVMYPFALICVSTIILVQPMYGFYPRQNLDNLNTIRFIQTLTLKNSVIMLEAEGGYNIYLGDNFSRVPEYAKGENFDAFMSKHSINAIVISGALRNDSRFKTDSEWLKFIASPEQFGFTAYDIPSVADRKVLLKTKG